MAQDLPSILGEEASSKQVREIIKAYGLNEIDDSRANGRYQGSKKNGLDLVIDNEHVSAIQFYIEPGNKHAAFGGDLPFGIERGMSQQKVHDLLGKPAESSKRRSKFEMPNLNARLIVEYDSTSLLVNFLNLEYKHS